MVVTLSFRQAVNEIRVFLFFWGGGGVGIFCSVEWQFLANISGQLSSIDRPLKMAPLDCLETSVPNYQSALHKIPQELTSHLIFKGFETKWKTTCKHYLFIVNLQYIFPSAQQYDICIYFNITYIIILATCFDSYQSSSGHNFQELLVHIMLQYFMSYSTYYNREPFMHYKPELMFSRYWGGLVMHKGILISIGRIRHKIL